MPRNARPGFVLFGAPGFVGKLRAKYLARAAPDGVRIGLAGRSQGKLERGVKSSTLGRRVGA